MRSLCLAVLAVLLLGGAPAADAQTIPRRTAEALGFSPERLARIDAHFQQCVASGCLPGAVALIARHGEVAYFESFGMADRETGKAMPKDAIFRIASMTKPVTSVAVMMLYEEGRFLLNDPVSKYIPAFGDPQVLVEVDLSDTTFTTEPARREITIRDLLSHTSGIGYGVFHERLGPVYRKAGVPDAFVARDMTLADKIPVLAGLPLAHHPGERFTYGLSTDVLGYLVEVIAGMPLDRFLAERLFRPLGMDDTYFYLPAEKAERLVSLYRRSADGYVPHTPETVREAFPESAPDYPVEGARAYFSGGSALVSTASDYARFLQMLLNGGSLDGTRILSPKSVELMTVDHVEGSEDFGLGFAVTTHLGRTGELGSVGAYSWSGYWNTSFWVDPQEELIGIFMGQANPSAYDHGLFQVLVYQALARSERESRHEPKLEAPGTD